MVATNERPSSRTNGAGSEAPSIFGNDSNRPIGIESSQQQFDGPARRMKILAADEREPACLMNRAARIDAERRTCLE